MLPEKIMITFWPRAAMARLDLRLGAAPERHHRNHCADPDNDPSMVRIVRILLRLKARKATLIIASSRIINS